MSLKMASSAQSLGAARDTASLLSAFVQLSKPRVTRMVVLTMLCGALMAPGSIDAVLLALALVGTAAVVAAANTLNMVLEGDVDALMERTRTRPIPAGRIAPEIALAFGIALTVVGLTLLFVVVNPLTAMLAGVALLSYVLVYTPLKRVTPFALHVGAIPGAIPPVLGWTSVTGTLALPPLALFAILFVWQLPHFVAIAIFRQAEYEAAGIRVLPAVRGLSAAKRGIVAYSVLQLAVSVIPWAIDFVSPLYLAVALPLGLAYVGYGLLGLRREAGQAWARKLFFASMPYLVLVLVAIVVFRY
jgi:protoheme IX farnesyltransferase